MIDEQEKGNTKVPTEPKMSTPDEDTVAVDAVQPEETDKEEPVALDEDIQDEYIRDEGITDEEIKDKEIKGEEIKDQVIKDAVINDEEIKEDSAVLANDEELPEQRQEPADLQEPKEDEDAVDQSLFVNDVPVEIKEDDDGFEPGAIAEPSEHDVLNGRGASVNGHKGNQKFRALCFFRKPEFEAGNHAAKRRVATEIVAVTTGVGGRFLKRKSDKGPWFALTTEKAILKACQVMRDFQRPDRVQLRELQAQNGTRKRQRTTESTPGFSQLQQLEQLPPINENPEGVHEHDVISGRGAFVNGHSGNARFRTLAMERKPQFDAGNYSEKRALATEIVGMIRSLEPPGRFLRKMSTSPGINDENWDGSRTIDGQWEELSDEKAIHKACQVMRDIARPDRIDGRRSKKRKVGGEQVGFDAPKVELDKGYDDDAVGAANHSMSMLAETTAETTAVQEAVAATTEEILDKALDGPDPDKLRGEDDDEAAAEVAAAAASTETEV